MNSRLTVLMVGKRREEGIERHAGKSHLTRHLGTLSWILSARISLGGVSVRGSYKANPLALRPCWGDGRREFNARLASADSNGHEGDLCLEASRLMHTYTHARTRPACHETLPGSRTIEAEG